MGRERENVHFCFTSVGPSAGDLSKTEMKLSPEDVRLWGFSAAVHRSSYTSAVRRPSESPRAVLRSP